MHKKKLGRVTTLRCAQYKAVDWHCTTLRYTMKVIVTPNIFCVLFKFCNQITINMGTYFILKLCTYPLTRLWGKDVRNDNMQFSFGIAFYFILWRRISAQNWKFWLQQIPSYHLSTNPYDNISWYFLGLFIIQDYLSLNRRWNVNFSGKSS